MQFGKAVGTACSSFVLTNIDDLFVLVTFFAEASTSDTLTPLKIAIGQYLGFSVIIAISMLGFGLALVLPAEPIGFLGLLPILMGVWKLLDLLFSKENDEDEEMRVGEEAGGKRSRVVGMKNVLKVSLITVMNGGDNISTYIPLFSQARGAEIAVYVVVYYLLLGTWCLAAYLIMKQKHVLRVAQRYSGYVIPFLYMGLGIYIVVGSECYPWSVEHIDEDIDSHPGKPILGVVTTVVFLVCISSMLWVELRQRATKDDHGGASAELEGDVLNDDIAVRSSSKTDSRDSPEEAAEATIGRV